MRNMEVITSLSVNYQAEQRPCEDIMLADACKLGYFSILASSSSGLLWKEEENRPSSPALFSPLNPLLFFPTPPFQIHAGRRKRSQNRIKDYKDRAIVGIHLAQGPDAACSKAQCFIIVLSHISFFLLIGFLIRIQLQPKWWLTFCSCPSHCT